MDKITISLSEAVVILMVILVQTTIYLVFRAVALRYFRDKIQDLET